MAKQRITTNEVRTRIAELETIIQKNTEMGKAALDGISAMNSGITRNMQYNVIDKTTNVLNGLSSMLQSLQGGKNLLQKVVDAYESTDASLKKGVEDWVGDTHVSTFPGFTEHNNTLYDTLKYESCIMDQTAYDGPAFGYGANNGGCTATAWCIGLSMITGKEYDPTASNMWGGNGAKFPGQSKSIWANQSAMLSEAYNQIKAGKPCVFYANRKEGSYTGPHAVTIVGLNSDADPANLKMSDFLVVDPWEGQVRSLNEIGYYSYPGWSRLITYGDNLP